jgi:mycothiol synthase
VTDGRPAEQPIVVVPRIGDGQWAAVRRLLADAEAVDGAAALNEQALLTIEAGDSPGDRHLLGAGDDAGRLAAYGHLDLSGAAAGVEAECVVHPERRRRGWGELLVRRTVAESAPYPVLMWSHGDHPGARRLAERLGFDRVRDLWQMRRDLTTTLPDVELPDDVHLRTFVPGTDEPAWLAVNARAFASHPEQGGIDAVDLARRTRAEWFDPGGFFLAERDGRLVGFHWTKVHAGAGEGPVGEVYVVGVDPDAQGGGLGRALTLAGLQHLRDRGLGQVLLYVEADNLAARRLYERLGFDHVATDAQYRSRSGAS